VTTVFDPSLYNKKQPAVEEAVPVEVTKPVVKSQPPVVDDYDEIPEVEGMVFDPKLFKQVLSQPEGMNHKEYRKALGRYISTLSEFERFQIQSRREEIEAAEAEWKELNHSVLRRLDFSEAEAGMLMDKRLDSPGMRLLIRKRAEEVKKGRRAEAILRRVR